MVARVSPPKNAVSSFCGRRESHHQLPLTLAVPYLSKNKYAGPAAAGMFLEGNTLAFRLKRVISAWRS